MIRILLRVLLFLLGLTITVVLLIAFVYSRLNWTNGEILISGEQRKYILHVPENCDSAEPAPLVISLHGFAEWPAHQMQISHWNDLADEKGFLVVYPSGTGFPLRWNTNGQPGTATDPMREVQFITDLIDAMEDQYRIDPARIYVNGFSNGGGMAFVLACKLADRVAAMGGVAGAYILPWEECHPSRPVPVIAFHGTADPIVPYAGGESVGFHYPFPSITEWIKTWAARNHCTRDPLALPSVGEVSGVQYSGCDQQADVVLYTISGGGHAWPGGDPLPEFLVGRTTQEIQATRLMWEFFQSHPLTKE